MLGKRDKAMLSILFGSGVRRSEATRLEIQDLNLNEGMFQVVVKGDHLVEKYLAAWAIEPLREWIANIATTAIYDMTDQNIMKNIFGKKTG